MPTGIYERTAWHRERVSSGMKKYLADNPIARRHRGDAQRGVPRPEWVKRKISASHKGVKCSDEHKRRTSEAKIKYSSTEKGKKQLEEARSHIKGYIRTEKHRRIARDNMNRRFVEHPDKEWLSTPERKAKLSKIFKEQFKDREYKEKRIRQLRKGSHCKQNRIEKIVNDLLKESCPNEYKYTGNYDFMIGCRCPDFTNINGKKKVIEVYGDYWHGEKITGRNMQEEEKIRISHYFLYGFDCLIIWERELYEMPKSEIIKNIRDFNNKEVIHASS